MYRDTSDEVVKLLAGAVGVVEANSYESMCLWKEYHQNKGKSWKQESGLLVTVGRLDNRPVCLSIMPVVVDGHRILMIDATSQVVDHVMIDEWLSANLPPSAFRDKIMPGCKPPEKMYPNKVDAQNFHNVFPR